MHVKSDPETQSVKSLAPRAALLAAAVIAFGQIGLFADRAVATPDGKSASPVVPIAKKLVAGLLRHPHRLQLVGSAKSPQTFYFRIRMGVRNPLYACRALITSKAGHVVVVTYNDAGLPYAYYGDGIFVFVNTQRPGRLDVLLGASPLFLLGSQKAAGGGPPERGAIDLSAVAGTSGAAAVDLSTSLRAIAKFSTSTRYSASRRELIFSRAKNVKTIILAAHGRLFPIRSLELSGPHHTFSLYDITAGSLPPENLFGVTLAKVRSTDLPCTVWHYTPGMAMKWFPPPGYGSNQGEVQAAEALEKLMPISRRRVRRHRRRWMSKEIFALAKLHSRTAALRSIYANLEWGPAPAINEQAVSGGQVDPNKRRSHFNWNFNRTAFHDAMEKAWGPKVMSRLAGALEAIASDTKAGPADRLVAIDLLSDIGPCRSDADWAKKTGYIGKSFGATPRIGALLQGLFRARWDLPLSAGEIKAADSILSDPKANLLFRTWALEILCFSRNLHDDPAVIVPLVEASLSNPDLCLTATGVDRCIYDLSLCRAGRKILLKQLTSGHSALRDNSQVALAAFNGIWPGEPGYRLAIKVATTLMNDPLSSPHARSHAFGILCLQPEPAFRKFIDQQLGSEAKDFGWNMFVALTERKAAGDFVPELASLFERCGKDDKVRILDAIGFGFPNRSDANAVASIIRSALNDANIAVKMGGVHCIEELNFANVKLDDSQFYPVLRDMVKENLKETLHDQVQTLHSFSLATDGRWQMPLAGMTPGGERSNLQGDGLAWWQKHYAAVRASALKWAADHPHYPNPPGK